MFEREINFIYDFYANKIRKAGTYISYDHLKSCELHPAILQYVLGEIDFLLFEDRQKLLTDSAFDYNIPSVLNYFNLIAQEVKRNKKYSVNYIDKIIQHAATFTVNYLTKPNWTLTRFVFDDEKEKSASEIEQILSYIFYYPHLKKIISSYLKKKKIISINETDFRQLLINIDNASLETNYNKIIDETINSMSDFFNIGVSKKNHIPIKAIEYFLIDKNLHVHLKKFEKDFNPELSQKVSAIEIKDYLKRILIEKQEYIENDIGDSVIESSNLENEKTDEQISISSVENYSPVTADSDHDNNESEQRFESESMPNNEELETLQKIEEQVGESESPSDNNDEDEQQLSLINEDLIEDSEDELFKDEQRLTPDKNEEKSNLVFDESNNLQDAQKNIEDETKPDDLEDLYLTEILNDNSMTKILDVVFDYDVEEFSSAIKKIITSASEEEAYFLIDKICEKAQLKPDSKESKTFKTVISKYFK